jgi:hypothetical protein
MPTLEVVQVLNAVPGLMQQGKTEEARAKLEDVLTNVSLRFVDRTAISTLLADIAFTRGDYLEARRLALIATLPNLPPASQKEAWLTRIKADLMLSDVSGADISFSRLQQNVGTFAPESALPKLMQTARNVWRYECLRRAQVEGRWKSTFSRWLSQEGVVC